MLPLKSNQTILDAISGSDGPITLGLLPLTAQEEEACINNVISHCAGNLRSLVDLLKILTPAAAAYAIAAGASQAVSQGAEFWGPLADKLGINLSDSQSRELLSTAFRSACRRLGVMDPDVSELAWKNIAPMMAQASILHRWTEALGMGIQTTLRNRPLPDLDDPAALLKFALDLASHTRGQPNLKKILHTEVGGIVVHRLISSCVYNRYDILPAHLIEPMRQAFEGGGRQVTLKSPYVSFSLVRGGFELVLPKQPGKLISHQTYWLVSGSQYSPVSEERLSEFEIGAGTLAIQLRNVAAGYPDHTFTVNLALDQPFRVFDESTMRERMVRVGEETSLLPGDYLLVLKPDAVTNDADGEEIRGNYKVLPGVVMRPGQEPLIVTHDETVSTLSPVLKAGIYQSSDDGLFSALGDGKHLHYGGTFGFLAFIPKSQHTGDLDIQVTSRDAVLFEMKVTLQSHDQGVYDYSQNLENALKEAVQSLQPGVHPIQIRIATNATSATRELWYWKGLERISNHKGFLCSAAPLNIDFSLSKGFRESNTGCSFVENYRAPKVIISLKQGETIELRRAGIQATCIDTVDNWQTEIRAYENLAVSDTDARVIQLESGGFEEWIIRCNDRELAKLDQKRTRQFIGLRSLLADFGKSGRVCAISEDGEEIRLFSFSSDLVASTLAIALDHGRGLEKWTTTVPIEGVGKLGLVILDYSDSPIPSESPVILLYNDDSPLVEESEITVDATEGVSAVMQRIAAQGNVPARVKVCLHISPEETTRRFLTIDLVQMPPQGDQWKPLYCIDGPNTSQLSIVVSGGAIIDRDNCSWWRHLWRVSQNNFIAEDHFMYEHLTESDIESALVTISRLTTVKYPTNVYTRSAKYLSSLSHKLSARREAGGHRDNDIWWGAAATELAAHAGAALSPVVRQFLFTNNTHLMRRVWTSERETPQVDRGHVIRSLSLANEVRKAGGLVDYAKSFYHQGTHPLELFHSFKNWVEVSTNRADCFTDFDFNLFFREILKRVAQHSEADTSFESMPVLSARHLLYATNSLNRRVRVLTRASAGNAGHSLTGVLQSLISVHQKLEGRIGGLNDKLGYKPVARGFNFDRPDHYESVYYPDIPLLSSPQAKQIADLTWAFCVATRAKAHGRISSDEFQNTFALFSGVSVQTHPINLILSFTPELFSYYTALLDFGLYQNLPVNQS
jgi:hypothetical protein